MARRLCIWVVALGVVAGFARSVGSQTVVDSFPAPGNQTRGLTWDGVFLWNADASDTVYRIDPSGVTELLSFYFPIDSAFGGITWSSDGKLWIANGGYIYKVDPATGEVVYSFPCPGG